MQGMERYLKAEEAKKSTSQKTSNSNPRNAIKYYLEKGEFNKANEYIKEYGLEDERDSFLENLNYKVRSDYKKHNQEYELYKKAKERPNEIDPMTENSTDWEALDRKYKDYYKKENIGSPSNYKKGENIEFDNGYYGTVKGKIVREATDNDKEFKMNNNLKGYIVKDERGHEHVVADTRIKKSNSTNNTIKEEYLQYMREHPNVNTDIDTFEKNISWYRERKNNENGSKKEFHFAGEELYSEDPNRFGDKLRKINDKMNSPLDSSLKGLNKIDSIAGDDEKLQTLGRKIGANSLVRYKKAWEEYRREHPNSKLNLYSFIKMNEE